MTHLLPELKTGYLKNLLDFYHEIPSLYPIENDALVIGGSVALMIYGLIPYRYPKDLDVIFSDNHKLFKEVDLNKDNYYGVEFNYRATEGGFYLTIDGIEKPEPFDSLEQLKINIRIYVLEKKYNIQNTSYQENQHNVEDCYTVHNEHVHIDLLKSDNLEDIYKTTLFGKFIYLSCPKEILEARMKYGFNHDHILETCDTILKLNNWENPFDLYTEHSNDLPF